MLPYVKVEVLKKKTEKKHTSPVGNRRNLLVKLYIRTVVCKVCERKDFKLMVPAYFRANLCNKLVQ